MEKATSKSTISTNIEKGNSDKQTSSLGRGPHAKNWTFTLNNPQAQLPPWPDIFYRCYQREKGKKCATEHFQGFVMFNKKKYLSQLKKFNDKIHWEVMRGTPQQNLDYCTKSDTKLDGPWEEGVEREEAMKQTCGRRTDLEEAIECFKTEGKRAACEKFPDLMVMYGRGIGDVAINSLERHVRKNPKNLIFWGDPNSGKTYKACHDFGSCYFVPKCVNGNIWFNGYDGQETIIFDEFGKGNYPITTMNTLLDKECPMVEVKNGFVYPRWDNVIIISNDDPNTWYTGNNCSDVQRDAFFSRITHITHFTGSHRESWRGSEKTQYTTFSKGKFLDSKGYINNEQDTLKVYGIVKTRNLIPDPEVSWGNTMPQDPTAGSFEKISVTLDLDKKDQDEDSGDQLSWEACNVIRSLGRRF